MAESKLHLQRVALDLRAIADTEDFEISRKALGHPFDQIGDQCPLHAPHRPRPLVIVHCAHNDGVVPQLRRDFGHQRHAELTELALGGHDLAIDAHLDATGDGNWVFSDSRHIQITLQSTSPPTLLARASWSDKTPLGVDRIEMPSPLQTSLRSAMPE